MPMRGKSKNNQIHPTIGYEGTLFFHKDNDLSVHRAGSRVVSQTSLDCEHNSYGMLQANGRGPSPKTGRTVTPRDGSAHIRGDPVIKGHGARPQCAENYGMVDLHLGIRQCMRCMHKRGVTSWGLWQPAIGPSRGRTLGGRLMTVSKKNMKIYDMFDVSKSISKFGR